MLNISVKVEGLELFLGPPELRAALREALRQSAQTIKGRAEANLSGRFVRIRTGKLRRGLQLRVRESGAYFIAMVRSTVFYGHILEGGAKAHKIPRRLGRRAQQHALARAGLVTPGERRPGEAAYLRGERVRPKVLRFEAGGKVIFATSVVHPGLRPRRWFASAVEEAIPELERIFERELGAAVTKRSVVA